MDVQLELHIERLVLHGIDPGDRCQIATALEQALTQLFLEQGVPPALTWGGAWDQVKIDGLAIAPQSSAEATGTQIAQAIYHGLTPTGSGMAWGEGVDRQGAEHP